MGMFLLGVAVLGWLLAAAFLGAAATERSNQACSAPGGMAGHRRGAALAGGVA